MKFRKKPVVIEAIQWDGWDAYTIAVFMGDNDDTLSHKNGELFIDTLEGRMTASKDDWIIKGVEGEFYPCKPDIFEKTYEVVEESEGD